MCHSLVAVIVDLNALVSSMEPDPMRSESILDAAKRMQREEEEPEGLLAGNMSRGRC